jgi:hypothetical protein
VSSGNLETPGGGSAGTSAGAPLLAGCPAPGEPAENGDPFAAALGAFGEAGFSGSPQAQRCAQPLAVASPKLMLNAAAAVLNTPAAPIRRSNIP